MKNIDEFGKYTKWSKRKTFKEERDLVIMAVEDKDEKIKEYLAPLIQYWWNGFKKHSQTKLTDKEILKIGFINLEPALRTYYEKLKKEKVGFKFSTYFEWFIRQGFIDYLKENESNIK